MQPKPEHRRYASLPCPNSPCIHDFSYYQVPSSSSSSSSSASGDNVLYTYISSIYISTSLQLAPGRRRGYKWLRFWMITKQATSPKQASIPKQAAHSASGFTHSCTDIHFSRIYTLQRERHQHQKLRLPSSQYRHPHHPLVFACSKMWI